MQRQKILALLLFVVLLIALPILLNLKGKYKAVVPAAEVTTCADSTLRYLDSVDNVMDVLHEQLQAIKPAAGAAGKSK
jgi:hypothetical protein